MSGRVRVGWVRECQRRTLSFAAGFHCDSRRDSEALIKKDMDTDISSCALTERKHSCWSKQASNAKPWEQRRDSSQSRYGVLAH